MANCENNDKIDMANEKSTNLAKEKSRRMIWQKNQSGENGEFVFVLKLILTNENLP